MLPVPVLLLNGRGEIPVRAGRAVVLAMLASYCPSHTLIPTVVHRLVKPEVKLNAQGVHGWSADGRSFVCGVHHWFNRRLALIGSSYGVCGATARSTVWHLFWPVLQFPGSGLLLRAASVDLDFSLPSIPARWGFHARAANGPGSSSPKGSVASASRILYYVCQ
jgi:multidrug efflux pump subunit AcrB